MKYQNLKLDKSMYKNQSGFSGALERLDPSATYAGTDLAGLDAFERQLKRFDIKVSGASSSPISKFFSTSDSAALFPEYVSRAVAAGAKEAGIIDKIIASKTDISSPDYRSIITDLDDNDFSAPIGEGQVIPETNIVLSENLVPLKKRGRMLRASYEAIKFQRVDVFTVALSQVGNYIAKAQLKDAVDTLLNGGTPAQTISATGSGVAYQDLLNLWGAFDDFEMNVMLASPDMVLQLLAIEELRDPAYGLHFQGTGDLSTPLGARLIKSSAVPAGKVIALDKRFALEMVTSGGVVVEYDKLIDTQLERAALPSICGFCKLFPQAVKVLAR